MLLQVVHGKPLSSEDGGLTVQSLTKDGHKAIFLGIGMPDANRSPMFKDLTEKQGFYTSKSFLPRVSGASKPGKFQSVDMVNCTDMELIVCLPGLNILHAMAALVLILSFFPSPLQFVSQGPNRTRCRTW